MSAQLVKCCNGQTEDCTNNPYGKLIKCLKMWMEKTSEGFVCVFEFCVCVIGFWSGQVQEEDTVLPCYKIIFIVSIDNDNGHIWSLLVTAGNFGRGFIYSL